MKLLTPSRNAKKRSLSYSMTADEEQENEEAKHYFSALEELIFG